MRETMIRSFANLVQVGAIGPTLIPQEVMHAKNFSLIVLPRFCLRSYNMEMVSLCTTCQVQL